DIAVATDGWMCAGSDRRVGALRRDGAVQWVGEITGCAVNAQHALRGRGLALVAVSQRSLERADVDAALHHQLARRERGDEKADDHEVPERGVQLRRLQVDHRDGALLSARAELGGADLTYEKWEREHREETPCRQQPDDDGH